jgi:hypothetical protein
METPSATWCVCMLVQNGYRVLEARDGHHAMRLCEAHPGFQFSWC